MKPSAPRRNLSAPVRRFLLRLLIVSAYAYPLSLVAFCLAFPLVGEDWWITAGLLYAPRHAFAAPLVVLVPAIWLVGRRKLLWPQVAAALLALFPLMGFVLPWPVPDVAGRPSVKLLTFNVDKGHADTDRLLGQLLQLNPDLVLLQEALGHSALVEALRARFAHVESSTQFVIASRHPIVERTDPSRIEHLGHQRSPRFMRYVVDTPLGKLAIYNVHPISPRGTLGVQRFRGLLHRLRSGEILAGDPESDLGQNAALRSKQIALAAAMARNEPYPVVMAGDTNLPGLSATLRRELSGFDDAFRRTSWGFGYTFPQKYPFLRLDRVMASQALEFTEFQVGCPGVSDHFCIAARVVRR